MNIQWKTTLRPGEKWSGIIGKNKLLRFTALESGANLAALLYNRFDLFEKFNMPDTLKAQHTAHLTRGNALFSDKGRVLAAIVEDSTGWNDAIGGVTTRVMTDEKYEKTDYQHQRNDFLRSGYENFMIELECNGLKPRDFVPPVNLFSKVWCDENGDMHYDAANCKKGDTVTLRTEMDVLLLLSNTPNPIDDRRKYPAIPIRFEVLPATPADSLDFCVNTMPEVRRAYENTWDYYTLMD
ncbi:MAG: urea amidolyase associated protein UAAP1 [Ethanoligenens sp.]